METEVLQKLTETLFPMLPDFIEFLKKLGIGDRTIAGYKASLKVIFRILDDKNMSITDIDRPVFKKEYFKKDVKKRQQRLVTLKRFLWSKGIVTGKANVSEEKGSLDTACEAYIKELTVRGYRECSIISMRCDTNKFITLCKEKNILTLDGLSPKLVDDFLSLLFITNEKGYCHNQKIKILYALRGFFRWLYESGRTLFDLSGYVDVPKREKTLSMNFFSREEIMTLFKAVDTNTLLGFMDRAIFEVLYATGMRISELCNLRTEDADTVVGTLYIKRGKVGSDRYVPLYETARKYLEMYLSDVRPRILAMAKRLDDSATDTEYLFLTAQGTRLTECVMTRIIGRYLSDAGIKRRRTAHAFRYSAATHMLENGADIIRIAELLGHSKLDTTGRYTKVSTRNLFDAIRCHPRDETDRSKVRFKSSGSRRGVR